ncbi:unnamed protein product [Moneuplotes crassus]|uniref:Uncharacterized protein n=1 Tax=Euplotes crassus TaxID=5936 RepID=A0AAD1XC96_EUPCR|nr:unnamed protein product [Moneuplotes crassus]
MGDCQSCCSKPKTTVDFAEVRAEYKRIREKVSSHKTALKIYTKHNNWNFKKRIFQIYDSLVSLETRLDAVDPDKLGIEDSNTNCIKQYNRLDDKLGFLIGYTHEILLKAGQQNMIDLDSSGKSNKDKQKAKICLEKNIHQQSKEIDVGVLLSLEDKILPQRFKIFSVEFPSLDLKNDEHIKLLKNLKSLAIPNLNRLCVINISSQTLPALTSLFETSFLKRFGVLSLRFAKEIPANANRLFKNVLDTSYQVKSCVCIQGLTIKQSLLMKILSSCKDKSRIILRKCKISVEKVPDFGQSMNDSIIRVIEFPFCKITGTSGEPDSMEGFSNLIEGLSESQDFRDAFKGVKGFDSYDQKKARKILKQHRFGHIKVMNL